MRDTTFGFFGFVAGVVFVMISMNIASNDNYKGNSYTTNIRPQIDISTVKARYLSSQKTTTTKVSSSQVTVNDANICSNNKSSFQVNFPFICSHGQIKGVLDLDQNILRNFNLSENSLLMLRKSEIPTDIYTMRSLEVLVADGSDFDLYTKTSIPSEVGLLSNTLQYISIHDFNISSTVPSELGGLINLSHLDLRFNQLEGEVLFLTRLSSLEHLILQNNDFTGNLFQDNEISPNLKVIDVSDNAFSGEISRIGALRHLTHLNLKSNSFSGQVPWDEIMRMPNLTFIDLSYNKFEGSVPETFPNNIQLKCDFSGLNGCQGSLPSSDLSPVARIIYHVLIIIECFVACTFFWMLTLK
eukprot:c2495_g1_i1.p1 GENE.c2495_g1_i1~~c2495_g1_i1.p1  ORF type:complete len:356 (-),score=69.32 c2495_g1_i1:16-1083(-)